MTSVVCFCGAAGQHPFLTTYLCGSCAAEVVDLAESYLKAKRAGFDLATLLIQKGEEKKSKKVTEIANFLSQPRPT